MHTEPSLREAGGNKKKEVTSASLSDQCEPEAIEREPEVIECEPEVIEREPEVTECEPEVIEREPEVTECEPEAIERSRNR